ncbi:anthranilate phosphoribosyltransferase [Desmospora profundinema]|uniref:Anthranilate phosphoribosyltransferase n=1 Tax=Desmospora profundinema TaxID=1571184 RepID=A0ABU1IPP0_9BACL|nr:anthranilate phosphoribosyltransferase [Desmospora profundinema]MDR6226738.1 anthranilate phosphoribosyltransferase [Desmospora profundinema]
MFTLIREVGRGKKGAKDLSYDQARDGAVQIASGQATPAQIGAFLIAERIKKETPEEILAFVDVLRERSIQYPIQHGLDCAGPYDGRRKSFLATLPVAFVLAAAGLPVTLHGSRTLPPKCGITVMDLFCSLGVNTEQCPRDVLQTAADQTGFLFVPAENWCPPLASLRELREEIGVRTLFNTAEKLLRYSNAPLQTVGVFHQTAVDKMTQLLTRIGVRRGLIVQGIDGSEDLPIHRRTRVTIVENGDSQSSVLDPAAYGFNPEEKTPEHWTAEKQAAVLLEVLTGKTPSPCRNMVIWNSAIRLWFADLTPTIDEGVKLSARLLEEGHALARFQQWMEAVRPTSKTAAHEGVPHR